MKQEAPISLGGSSSLEQRKEVYKMRKTISNKTTKERIFDAINEGFFLDERNCKRYIKKINPTYFDDEEFIHKFLF